MLLRPDKSTRLVAAATRVCTRIGCIVARAWASWLTAALARGNFDRNQLQTWNSLGYTNSLGCWTTATISSTNTLRTTNFLTNTNQLQASTWAWLTAILCTSVARTELWTWVASATAISKRKTRKCQDSTKSQNGCKTKHVIPLLY